MHINVLYVTIELADELTIYISFESPVLAAIASIRSIYLNEIKAHL